MKAEEKFNKKLLVEGNDDQHVIWALCKRYELPETFDVIDCGGIEKLKKQLPVKFKTSGTDTIGVIIDADTDVNTSWDTIRNMIAKQGFTAPLTLPDTGLILMNESGEQKFGVWIMPDNHTNGVLEDFISFLIPENDRLLPIVNATLEQIEGEGLNKYALIHKPKATIHTWLAWQEKPGMPMGQGITNHYLETDENTCKKLIDWLKKLFSDDK